MKEIRLKVIEAVQDDVNKGIVRIDSSFMKELGVKQGDIIEIEGERTTVDIVDRAYPGDIGLNIIRMDGLTRRNAKTSIGEFVKVRKAEVKESKRVVIAPVQKGTPIFYSPMRLKRGLLGRALRKGDIVSLGGTSARRVTMSGSSFDEIFVNIIKEEFSGGFGFTDIKLIATEVNPKGNVIITENTEIIFNPEAVDVEEDEAQLFVTYEDIGGLEDEIKKVREMIELPLKHPEIFEQLGIEPPKGVLLHGPPGTGKTLLAKAVANETNSHFVLINGPEIMSKYYGQSEENLRKKFEEAQKNAPSIIFIDEIDAIASKREEVQGEVEKRVVAQLLAIMDGLQARGKVVVLAATNIPNVIDPALRRPGRFDREIEIGIPGKKARLEVLKIHTRNMPLDKDVNLKDIAEITHGFVGADLASLTKESAMIVLRRVIPDINLKDSDGPLPKEVLEKLRITKKDMKEALKVVRPSALREVLVEVPNVKWKSIGGLEDVKQELKEAVEWPLKKPEAFRRLGVKPPKGILIYGPPGTGKTMLAKAVANESDANFILVKGPELLSKWVGESEKAVRKIFTKARQASPSIIFFDEIDALAPRRGMSSDNNVSEKVVNQLLTEMDGLEELNDVVIIAATNRPDIIDTALLRPGRFDRIIMTPAPDKKARKEIFAVHTKKIPLAKDVKIEELTEVTEGYVGADIEAVVREAAMLALREDMKSKEVKMKHFKKAIEKVRPSVTKEIEDSYKDLQNYFKAATARQMQKEKPSYFG